MSAAQPMPTLRDGEKLDRFAAGRCFRCDRAFTREGRFLVGDEAEGIGRCFAHGPVCSTCVGNRRAWLDWFPAMPDLLAVVQAERISAGRRNGGPFRFFPGQPMRIEWWVGDILARVSHDAHDAGASAPPTPEELRALAARDEKLK